MLPVRFIGTSFPGEIFRRSLLATPIQMTLQTLPIQLGPRIPLLYPFAARNMQAKLARIAGVVCSTLRNH